MSSAAGGALTFLSVAMALMLIEAAISRRNEQTLKARGAIAPPDPVYGTMQWAYPGLFALMTVERVFQGTPVQSDLLGAGIVIFTLGKLVKGWAIASLGARWTYKVFVLPGAPLVARGPYQYVRHPNYIGVVGEIVGFALGIGALITGPLALVFFGWLLRQRIAAEERALGLR